jgi:hypothetical protein
VLGSRHPRQPSPLMAAAAVVVVAIVEGEVVVPLAVGWLLLLRACLHFQQPPLLALAPDPPPLCVC